MLVELLQVHEGQAGAVDPDPAPPPLPGGAAEVVRFFMDVPQWLQIGGAIVGAMAAMILLVLAWRHRTAFRAWIVGLPAVVKAATLAVVIAGGAVVSIAGYQVYDFVEHDNRFCTGCHLMAEAYVRFELSPHAELGCKECHAQPKTESARQLYLWVLERPLEVGEHAPVPDARCTSCHIDGDPEQWPQIAASLGHRIHFESEEPDLGELMCVTCHGVSVHEFSPAEETCGECHEAQATVRLGGMAAETGLHCIACHDFLGEEPATLAGVPQGLALLPQRAQCVACHEMGELLSGEEFDEDPHGAVCGACHNPHAQDTPSDAVETCMGCHEGADTITIFHTGTHASVLPDCTRCHSAHSWSVEGSDCLSCHGAVLEPPPGGAVPEMAREVRNVRTVRIPASLPLHVADVKWQGPTGRPMDLEGEPADPGATGETPRSSPVRWPDDRDRARQVIHGDPDGGPRTNGGERPSGASPLDTVPPQTPRPFTHRQHESLSCLQCHGRADEHGVITVRTARDCAACHHDPARGYACQDCHGRAQMALPREVTSSMSLTVWDEPRDREFSFEHDTHQELECQACHTGPVLLTVQTQCAECHGDHHRPQAECARCHVPTEPDVHGLEVHLTCTSSGCHAGTAGERPTLSRSLCLTCHVEQQDHEPGLECQRCHMVPVDPPVRPSAGGLRGYGAGVGATGESGR